MKFPPPFVSHKIYFFALLVIGIFLLQPLTDFLPFLSQGDHGLNLYAAEAILKGQIPYQDFTWFYGPAMPYYYAAFLKVFGTGIQSILLGKCLLILIAGLLIYCILSLYIPQIISCVGAIWFWIFFKDFPYTFNHTGGLPVFLLIFYFTLRYIQSSNPKFLYGNLFLILLLSLIKLNFGIAALLALIFIVLIVSLVQKKHPFLFYLLSGLAMPAIIVFVYWLFVRNLPFYYIQQCLPYFGTYFKITSFADAYQQNMFMNILVNGYLLVKSIFSCWGDFVFALLINLAAVKCFWLWNKSNLNQTYRREILLSLLAAITFYIFSLHEFIMLGVFYQAYWAEPFKVLLMFGIIGFALNNVSSLKKTLGALVVLGIALILIPQDSQLYAQFQSPKTRLDISGTSIEIGNDPTWVQTVLQTTSFLKRNLKKDESFFAATYDPLYYFLTEKIAPTHLLLLLNIFIPPEQELEIIKDLEDKKVSWILLSNRGNEPRIATIGKEYCPTLGQYIQDHFAIQAQFGDWDATPRWWSNHAVKILKRVK